MQARFEPAQVAISGRAQKWTRTADSGEPVENHFCPTCGSTVWYLSRPHKDLIAIPVGAFADPGFPAPKFSVYESKKHRWVAIVGDAIEHHD